MNKLSIISVLALAAACATEEPSLDPVTADAIQSVTVTACDGKTTEIDVLSAERGPSLERYVVRTGDRAYTISVELGDGFQSTEVATFDGNMLALLQQAEQDVQLVTADGVSFFSVTGQLPGDQMKGVVDPVILALLSDQALEALDGLPVNGIARSQHRLMKGGLGASCGVSCSSLDKLETCCCFEGDKCITTTQHCECKSAYGNGFGGFGRLGGSAIFTP